MGFIGALTVIQLMDYLQEHKGLKERYITKAHLIIGNKQLTKGGNLENTTQPMGNSTN